MHGNRHIISRLQEANRFRRTHTTGYQISSTRIGENKRLDTLVRELAANTKKYQSTFTLKDIGNAQAKGNQT